MLKPKIKIIALLFPLLLLAGFASPAMAQARGLVPCGGYADDKGAREPACSPQFFFAMAARVINFLIAAAGIYAVFQMVFSGFRLIISMGNEEDVTTNKKALTNVVVGFVLVLMAYVLINTVINFILLDGAPKEFKVDLANPFNYLVPAKTTTPPQ